MLVSKGNWLKTFSAWVNPYPPHKACLTFFLPQKNLTIHLGKYYQSHGFICFSILKFNHLKKNAQEKLAGGKVFSLPCFGGEFCGGSTEGQSFEERGEGHNWADVFSACENPFMLGEDGWLITFPWWVVWGEFSFPYHPCIWYIYPLFYHTIHQM